VPKEIYYSDTIPILLSPEVFAAVTLCALAIAYLASKIPARLSAKIDPLEAIRND
jgi:lipoprotein-releasing system permease protein